MEIWMGIAHGLAYVILGGLGWWLASLHGRVSRVEHSYSSLELKMANYQGDIRVANVTMAAIQKTLEGHIYREEHETWAKIDALTGEFSEMRVNMATIVTELKSIGEANRRALAHAVDHEKGADDWKQRIVAVETEIKRLHGT